MIRRLRWPFAMRSAVLGAALLLASAASGYQAPIAFDTHGGDAWDFYKSVTVSVSRGRCDRVVVKSPLTAIVLRPERGRVHARLPLQSGDNEIEAECREHGSTVATVQQHWRLRLADTPVASIQVSERGSNVTLDARASTQAPVRPAAIVKYEWRTDIGNPHPLAGLPASGPRIDISAPPADGEYKITLRVTDRRGRSDESTVLLRAQHGVLRQVDPVRDHAAWIDRAVIYGVIPRLFGPRGLPDVTAHLDQLADLGITALWLSPITASAPGDFGYAVTDDFSLRPGIGTKQELHDLVRAAHARGIRVILDLVPNHLSDRSGYFVDTVEHAHASPYFNFFQRDRDGHPRHYFDWSNLENLNYASPQVRHLVTAAFVYWVRTFDVDGFRVDAAWGPRQRDPDFWPQLRTALQRIKPDLLLLAEASARDPYYGRHGFDAAYDWTDQLGKWAWRKAFDDVPNTARLLHAAIEASAASDALVFRFLDNNDTGRRFLSRYGLARTRVAAAMLLTLPGIPCIYTGEEVGAAYEPYKQSQPIVWKDPDKLRAWYRRLIALRHAYPALRSRKLRLLAVPPNDNVLAYVRTGERASDSIFVILNYGEEAASVSLPSDALGPTQGAKLVDLLSGDEIAPASSGIAVAPYGVLLLKRE